MSEGVVTEGAGTARLRRAVLVVLAALLAVGLGRVLGACTAEQDTTAEPPAAVQEEQAEPDAAPAGGDEPAASTASSEDNQNLTLADLPEGVLISVDELEAMRASDNPPFIVDIRGQNWWMDGHIPEARNIPAGKQFDIRMDEIPRDSEVVVIVPRNEERVAEVWQTLVDAGYDGDLLKALEGGMDAWSAAGGDIQEEEHLGC